MSELYTYDATALLALAGKLEPICSNMEGQISEYLSKMEGLKESWQDGETLPFLLERVRKTHSKISEYVSEIKRKREVLEKRAEKINAKPKGF